MNRLALFARVPEVGKVKTRLSPALPPEMACTLYRGMLEDALEALRGAAGVDERFVYWASGGDAALAAGVAEREQCGGDLGERLSAAFDELLAEPGDRAVIFGADCPELGAAHLEEALARLRDADLVLAPSRDGGYALIALAQRAPELFRGVDWSGRGVFAQTLERARATGLRITLMEPLDDVDTPDDLCRLVALAILLNPAHLGPRTIEALAKLRVAANIAGRSA